MTEPQRPALGQQGLTTALWGPGRQADILQGDPLGMTVTAAPQELPHGEANTPGASLTSLSKMKAGGLGAGLGVSAQPTPQGASPLEKPYSVNLDPSCSFYLKFLGGKCHVIHLVIVFSLLFLSSSMWSDLDEQGHFPLSCPRSALLHLNLTGLVKSKDSRRLTKRNCGRAPPVPGKA